MFFVFSFKSIVRDSIVFQLYNYIPIHAYISFESRLPNMCFRNHEKPEMDQSIGLARFEELTSDVLKDVVASFSSSAASLAKHDIARDQLVGHNFAAQSIIANSKFLQDLIRSHPGLKLFVADLNRGRQQDKRYVSSLIDFTSLVGWRAQSPSKFLPN